MYTLDFNHPIHVHFVGIGGISMSGLAEILLSKGFTISGSDTKESDLTKRLVTLGAKVCFRQTKENIHAAIDLIVYTAAIREDNLEFIAACESNIPMLTRAELLGQIMDNYSRSVAISGTHGKTTTTSMMSQILLTSNCDPTLSVGGILKAIGGNIRVGKSDVFVTEACEYTNSFLHFHPAISIILNVEAEHLDFFKDLSDVRNSFHRFAKNTLAGGLLIINGEIEHHEELTKEIDCEVVTYGLTKDCDYYGYNIAFDELGFGSFDLSIKGQEMGRIQLQVPGLHNISNSIAAIAACLKLNVPFSSVSSSLLLFSGTNRRFEYKGTLENGATVVDDYSHHPTEIKAALTAAKNGPYSRIVCVFQPHTYSRTKAFLSEFADALSLADEILLTDIYAAREKNTYGITSLDLEKELIKTGTKVTYMPDFFNVEEYLKKNSMHGDLLITMGAGDVVQIGEHILIH